MHLLQACGSIVTCHDEHGLLVCEKCTEMVVIFQTSKGKITKIVIYD